MGKRSSGRGHSSYMRAFMRGENPQLSDYVGAYDALREVVIWDFDFNFFGAAFHFSFRNPHHDLILCQISQNNVVLCEGTSFTSSHDAMWNAIQDLSRLFDDELDDLIDDTFEPIVEEQEWEKLPSDQKWFTCEVCGECMGVYEKSEDNDEVCKQCVVNDIYNSIV